MKAEAARVKARFVQRGDFLITAAIAIANVPELEREVKEVFTGPTHSEIRCVDGTDWTFPRESLVPIVVASR